MRKLLVVAVSALALVGLMTVNARAEEGSGLEISGNVTTVTGYQRGDKTKAALGSEGILNDGLLALPAISAKSDQFGFFVDQVELDLAKSFGENIRARADLDFSPHRGISAPAGVYVEQGYITANIPAGNGAELLVGRFNSGIGLDPVNRNELSTVSFSSVHRTLLPDNMTGARVGYNFSEATRLETFVVNQLNDVAPAGNNLPSFGVNVSHSWGDEANKNWVKFNGAGGPEAPGTKKHWSFLGDLNGHMVVNDAFSVGAEGVYRQDDNTTAGGLNSKYIGGQLKGTYKFSDVWDGTFRYGFIWDKSKGAGTIVAPNALTPSPGLGGASATVAGVVTGAAGTGHQISLASGYQITDGARLVVEGSVDMTRAAGGAAGTALIPGFAGMFAYSF